MKKSHELELRELSQSVMDIVAIAAGRRLQQVLEQVHAENIAPLEVRIKELEAELAQARRGGDRNAPPNAPEVT